jgi:protein-disulfide isomerase
VKYAIIDLPLETIHSAAFRAAEMVRCAGAQGKYWDMRARLFANPQAIDQTASHAGALGLDAKQFDACVAAGTFDADIRKDMAQAEAAGINGTPSFVLGVSDPASGKFKPVKLITGAQPFAAFKAQIDALMAEQ